MESRKTVSLIVPSDIVARGLGSILEESGEFRVEEVFHDFSKAAESRLRGVDPDVVIIDPVILDFKTDRTEDLQGLSKTYSPQLRWYAEALRELTGEPVKECWLWSLACRRAVRAET